MLLCDLQMTGVRVAVPYFSSSKTNLENSFGNMCNSLCTSFRQDKLPVSSRN